MSTELKKGDLVMTERGFAVYIRPVRNNKHFLCHKFGEECALYFEQARPLTSEHRPQVEAYLKQKGWEWIKAGDDKIDSSFYCKEGSDCIVSRFEDGRFTINLFELHPDQFDSAPAQLAEAILMARLLNATKP